MTDLQQKRLDALTTLLRDLGNVVVAFSGGVDSTLLAAAALRTLGPDHMAAVTAVSATLAEEERRDCAALAAAFGMPHFFLPLSELEEPAFVRNDGERCYHCKRFRFLRLVAWAAERGFTWVLEGSNADDLTDYRPGLRAVRELAAPAPGRTGVRAPLLELGFTKEDIRSISKAWELPTWNKPAAACLASRIPYGVPLTEERLRRVGIAEAAVRRFCSSGTDLRVRDMDDTACIEVSPEAMPRLVTAEATEALLREFAALGFRRVVLDLGGYRRGSLNEALDLGASPPAPTGGGTDV
ncbi:ATP-dependent sacrificial sulfur transferase LarE [Aminiphilus circumscriptus]|jgi:uncharacterized protein|uniref:ATP-dependent sacrificial sulfur transferase LarE n=1 Tax=Aminiphilus circumscriptus TaxID=290732 RepID=UPI000478533F|nr:ATP-dependent sacrificial sulfur transferase LarE [Aminiphilus circumscriptus]